MRVYAANVRKVVVGHLTMDFSGFLYLPGYVAGEESAKALLEEWTRLGPLAAGTRLYGSFLAVVHDASTDTDYAFVDNGGVYPAFYSDGVISDSFRQLILDPQVETAVDVDNVVEFLLLGFNGRSRTMGLGIAQLLGSEMIKATESSFRVVRKQLPPLSEIVSTSDGYLHTSFRDFQTAVSGMNISADLTGGVDSRLVASYLSSTGTPFETALSAKSDHIDVRISSKVAKKLHRSHFVTHPNNEGSINFPDLYKASDATFGNLEVIDRKGRLQKDRAKRGINISVDGNGGALYKDAEWLQDFPFYKRKKANIERFYRLRVESVLMPTYFVTTETQERISAVRSRIISEYRETSEEYNTKIYDHIYYDRQQQSAGQANAALFRLSGVFAYASLLEYDRVRYAFNLRRSDRIFDRLHRREISAYAPQLAPIRTNKGTPLTTGVGASLDLAFTYSKNLTKRTINKTAQRLIGRRLIRLPEPGNAAAFSDSLMSTKHYQQARQKLIHAGLIRKDFDDLKLPPTYIMRLFVVGLVMTEIESKTAIHD